MRRRHDRAGAVPHRAVVPALVSATAVNLGAIAAAVLGRTLMGHQATDHDKWKSWLESIEEDGKNLTPWEEDFISDLRDKFDNYPRVYLSERQADVLERIYAEKTP